MILPRSHFRLKDALEKSEVKYQLNWVQNVIRSNLELLMVFESLPHVLADIMLNDVHIFFCSLTLV